MESVIPLATIFTLRTEVQNMPLAPYDPSNEPENDERVPSIDEIVDRILNGRKILSLSWTVRE